MAQTVPAIYRAEGDDLDYTPGSALTAGDVVDLGDMVGIVIRDIAANELGALRIKGVFDVLKKTGETWTQWETVYYDAGTTTFSNTAGYSEAVAGIIIADAASGDATGRILLLPGVVRS